MLLSPSGLLESLSREVILKKPEEFKIGCLHNLRALWPHTHNPFHAGFGNRDSDTVSYKEVGVPPARIFVINPQGAIRLDGQVFALAASYPKLIEVVHQMFPFILSADEEEVEEDYTSFNFWRMQPLPLPPELDTPSATNPSIFATTPLASPLPVGSSISSGRATPHAFFASAMAEDTPPTELFTEPPDLIPTSFRVHVDIDAQPTLV